MESLHIWTALIVAALTPLAPTCLAAQDWPLAFVRGVVRDTDGRPIEGAVVELKSLEIRGNGDYEIRSNSPGAGAAISDSHGAYRLGFYAQQGGTYEIKRITSRASGFVPSNFDGRSKRPVVETDKTVDLDITLERGELLSGTVGGRPRLKDRLDGNDRRHTVRVHGPSYALTELSRPDGTFEFWVPRGTYSVAWMRGGAEFVKLENVPSGSSHLKLEAAEPKLENGVAARCFEALCDDMARNYSYFELKKIDWPALRDKYRPRAKAAESIADFVDVLGEMLGELQDGHIWFTEPSDAVVAFRPTPRPTRANLDAILATLSEPQALGRGYARVGTTKPHGFGAILITRQSEATPRAAGAVVEFIRAHADAPGFVIDLRGADGGNEILAQRIAREFCSQPTVYARSKFRNGPLPGDFGPARDRVLTPSEQPFTKPVVCILGPGCVSSGEGFAKMLVCLPQVTSVGTATRGSSGNPQPFRLPGLPVAVMYSRWVDMLPDGTPVEDRGILPELPIDLPESAYADADPTWQRALRVLREKISKLSPPGAAKG
jgi:hypothetical protein